MIIHLSNCFIKMLQEIKSQSLTALTNILNKDKNVVHKNLSRVFNEVRRFST